jgi:hypothetical protein
VNSQLLGIEKNIKAMTAELTINSQAMEVLKRYKFKFEKKRSESAYTSTTAYVMFNS